MCGLGFGRALLASGSALVRRAVWQAVDGPRATRDQKRIGSPDGNRTRISALKGPRANRCTTGPRKCTAATERIAVRRISLYGLFGIWPSKHGNVIPKTAEFAVRGIAAEGSTSLAAGGAIPRRKNGSSG